MELNVFDGDGFSLQQLTAAINRLPEVPTKLGALGVFEESGVTTTRVSIEKRDEGLTLVATTPRGGPGETVGGESRNKVPIDIPHFQRDDAVMADEVQNVRAFGTENVLETLQSRVDLKLARHTRSFDFTLEFMRLGAAAGVIYDKDGNIILDCFDRFKIARNATVDFVLGTAGTDVRGKCAKVMDNIEDGLEGEVMPRVYGLAGDTFYEKLVTHATVVATYANWPAAAALRGDPRLPFEFGGISWIRYHTRPKAQKAIGNKPLIAANGVRFIAGGVPGLFVTNFAPADYEETVNTVGLPRYARQFPMPNGKGRHLEAQTNAICYCTRPEALQDGFTSN
jgi:hypothetical protein